MYYLINTNTATVHKLSLKLGRLKCGKAYPPDYTLLTESALTNGPWDHKCKMCFMTSKYRTWNS